ncbi:MAG: hypothetical protein V4722_12555 [Bacteroidota bacterium]
MSPVVISKITVVICLVVLPFLQAVAQMPASSDSIEKQITFIRSGYQKINTAGKQLRVKETDIEGESTEGGTMKKYYLKDSLRKVVATYYGETGQLTIEYYFISPGRYFIFEKESSYKNPLFSGKVVIASVNEQRYYFYNGKLIRWLDNKRTIKNKAQMEEKQVALLKDIEEDFGKEIPLR